LYDIYQRYSIDTNILHLSLVWRTMIYVGNFIYHGASNTKETLTNVI